MVDRPDAEVGDVGAAAGGEEVGAAVPVAVGGGADGEDVGGGGGCGGGEPDYYAFPLCGVLVYKRGEKGKGVL